ncbi:MAG: thymidylate synthase [Clostridia bacterium]
MRIRWRESGCNSTRRAEAFEAPALWINPEIQDFYAFQIQDIKLIGYKSHDKISMEVAV